MSALALTASVLLCATLDRRAFASALSRLKHIVPRRSMLPALESVLIEAVGDALSLTASDASVFVRVLVPATLASSGALLLPLRRLTEVVRGSSANVKIAGEHVTVGAATHRIAGLAPATYPVVPQPSGEVLVSMLRPTLAQMLAQTTYAMSEDEARPHLCALFIERRDGELRFVTTDGHRLALARVPDDGPPFSVLVPRKAIEQVERLVALHGGVVRIQRDGDRVWFVSGDEWVSAPVVEAKFPAYEQVIPPPSEARVTVATGELRDALLAVAPRGEPGVRLLFDPEQIRVQLSVTGDEGNTTKTGVLAAFVGVVPAAMRVNGRFLREVAEALGEDATVTLQLGRELDPVRVDGAHGVTVVFMPMKP